MEVATQVKNKIRSRKKNSTELHTSSSIGWIFFPLVLLLFHISDRIVVICMRTYFQEASRHTRFLCVYFIKTVVVVVVFFFSFFFWINVKLSHYSVVITIHHRRHRHPEHCGMYSNAAISDGKPNSGNIRDAPQLHHHTQQCVEKITNSGNSSKGMPEKQMHGVNGARMR